MNMDMINKEQQDNTDRDSIMNRDIQRWHMLWTLDAE